MNTPPPPIAPEDEAELQTIIDREFVKPATEFKGVPLLPYSRGSRMLYGIVQTDNDSIVYRCLAFIYIHTHPRQEMATLCWDLPAFRAAVADFRDTLSDSEEEQAIAIVTALIDSERRTEIAPATGAKKKEND